MAFGIIYSDNNATYHFLNLSARNSKDLIKMSGMALTELTWAYTFFCGQLHIIYVPLLILDKLTQMWVGAGHWMI